MKIIPKPLLIAAAMARGTSTSAQTTDFPEGAEPLTQEALHAALAGKVFLMTPAKGPEWRWQFNDNGYFFFNAGQYANSGKWSTKDSTVCQDTGKTIGCAVDEFGNDDFIETGSDDADADVVFIEKSGNDIHEEVSFGYVTYFVNGKV